MLTPRMPDSDPKWITGTLCTNGEWPCEMSTHIAWLEMVNAALLEACKLALPELEFDARHCPSDSPLNAAVNAMRQAIKLAEGKE